MTVAKSKKRKKKAKTARKRKCRAPRQFERTPTFQMYVLNSLDGRRTYVGVTKDLDRRLRQHNRELAGGARTTAGREWRVAAVVGNFSSDGAALSVEKVMHCKGQRWLPLWMTGWTTPLQRRLDCLRATLARVSAKRFNEGGPSLKVFCAR